MNSKTGQLFRSMDILTENEHGDLCVYLDTLLAEINPLMIHARQRGDWQEADVLSEKVKRASDTLGELLAIDAIGAGL